MLCAVRCGDDDDGRRRYAQRALTHTLHDTTHNKNQNKKTNKTKQKVKLAISHALAQCTKLSVYEERITDLVLATKHLPESLAADGTVKISRKQIARLIGTVFLQRASVNLLSTVLDTPEFFWSAPDHLQTLYKRVCEYLELETRGEWFCC